MINWKQYSERWYAGYAFQGAVVLGIIPILLPLVIAKAGGAAQAGVVVALFYVGQLLAPVIGAFTDRSGLHKTVFLSGFVMLAIGLTLFPTASNLPFWLLLSMLQGAGSAASNTVSAMFIVEWRPKGEWDQRVGWLQTFYGTGQAVGLGLAALLQMKPELGLIFAALLMIPGFILGRMDLPKTADRNVPEAPELDRRRHMTTRGALPQTHHYERFNGQHLLQLAKKAKTPYGRFIISWFMIQFGTWIIYNLYPLFMKSAYSIAAGPSSTYYAIAAFLGIFAYAPSGVIGKKIGDGKVVMIGTVMTLISQLGLALLAYIDTGMNTWLAPVMFIIQPIAWSPLIVAGTAFAAQLSDMEEGPAVGIFNATTAIAAVLSAFAAGFLAEAFGYGTLPAIGTVLVLAGGAVLLPIVGGREE
ncbi:MFS transporter [Desulfovibrio sp. JC010]|uniref:MFS transporter n=1 Tax=Desulfovibrio sp. JC010 TaxID=2593641 RepID=UPI0013D1D1C5|nr:MFS transporter [Desulfovibrio sp. JC010]NDV28884.1 MFS transporter [Desulfovibrio sp. JC010]